jgi:hypothetical protein
MQAEEAEQPSSSGAELLDGPREHRPDACLGIAGVEGIEAAAGVAQLGGQSG